MFRLNANNVSAACAVLTMIGGGASTVVSWYKADEAAESARVSAEQLALAKEQAQLSANNLAEMRGLRAATEDQASSAARSASAAERVSDVAASQASSLAGTRVATEAMMRTVEGQLAEARAANRNVTSSRITFRSSSVLAVGPGKKSLVRLNFDKSGQSEPREITMWSSMMWRTGAQEKLQAPACGSGSGWHSLGPFSQGQFDSEARVAMTSNEHQTYMVNGRGFFTYGAVCYKDIYGQQHRTDFCLIVSGSGDTPVCHGTADPT